MNQKYWLVWILALFLKLILAYNAPLFSDEMYYWVWGQRPSLSYFDHPPFVAWLFKVGTLFDGYGFAVRWPSVILSHFSIVFWMLVASRFLISTQLSVFFLCMILNPVTSIGSIVVVPDAPLMFFWSAAVYCVIRCHETSSTKWYALLGLVCGLGFCSKYHMALLLPMVIIWILWQEDFKWIKWYQPLLAIVIAVLASSPVFIWNATHEWASFKFQLTRGLGKSYQFRWVLDYIGGQIALIFPLVLFVAIKASRTLRVEKNMKLVVVLAWTLPLFFLFSSTKGRVEPNWTSVALPAIFILASAISSMRKLVYISCAAWSAAILALVIQMIHPILPINYKTLKTNEYYAFDEILPIVKNYSPLYVNSYQLASTIHYRLRIPVTKLRGVHRMDHFDLLPESMPTENVFYAVLSRWNALPDWTNAYTVEVVSPELQLDTMVYRFTKK